MPTEIRLAVEDDAPVIARIMRAAWAGNDDTTDPARIARVIRAASHLTLIAEQDGSPAGFVDSFITLSAAGVPRLEIDLLAVDPQEQGKRIGAGLVEVASATAAQSGCTLSRALVRLDNAPMQRVMEKCGFRALHPSTLMIHDGAADDPAVEPPGEAYWLSVSTFTYDGVWLEGGLSAGAFASAAAIRARLGGEQVGAVIPSSWADLIADAAKVGFAAVGDYQWWVSP